MTDEQKAQVRRRMLHVARINSENHANGFVPGMQFMAVRDDEGNECPDDLCVALLGDLVGENLLEESSAPTMLGVKPGIRHRRFKLSTKGWRLLNEEIPAIVGIADRRFGD